MPKLGVVERDNDTGSAESGGYREVLGRKMRKVGDGMRGGGLGGEDRGVGRGMHVDGLGMEWVSPRAGVGDKIGGTSTGGWTGGSRRQENRSERGCRAE